MFHTQRISGVTSIVLFLVLLVTYLAFPSQQYDPDTLGELQLIGNLDNGYDSPAHMLYVQVGIPAYKLWLSLGNTANPLLVMQKINALSGAAAILFLALIMGELRLKPYFAIMISLAAGYSYAFWTHTVDAFFVVPGVCFALLSLLCAFWLVNMKGNRAIKLGLLIISLSLAALFYQNNLLIIPALLVASWNGKWRVWFRDWIIVGLGFLILAGSVWLWQAFEIAGAQNFSEAISWFVSGHGGISRGLWRREGVDLFGTTLIALTAVILPVYEGLGLRNLAQGQINFTQLPSQAALLVLFLVLLLCIFIVLKSYSEKKLLVQRQHWLTCALWFIVPGFTVLWFDRAEVKLWLIPMFGVWMLIAIILNLSDNFRRLSRLAIGLTAMLTALIFTGNWMLVIWPNYYQPSDEIIKAKATRAYLTEDDLLLTATFGWPAQLSYLCPNCEIVNALALAQKVSKEDEYLVKQEIMNRIEQTWEQGYDVYVMDYLVNSNNEIWSAWVTPYTGLVPSDFENFESEIAWAFEDGETVWKLENRIESS